MEKATRFFSRQSPQSAKREKDDTTESTSFESESGSDLSHSNMPKLLRGMTVQNLVPTAPDIGIGGGSTRRKNVIVDGDLGSAKSSKRRSTGVTGLLGSKENGTVNSFEILEEGVVPKSKSGMIRLLMKSIAEKEEEIVRLRDENRLMEMKLCDRERSVAEMEETILEFKSRECAVTAQSAEEEKDRKKAQELERRLNRLSEMYRGAEKNTERELLHLRQQMQDQMERLEVEKTKMIKEFLAERESASKEFTAERRELEKKIQEADKALCLTNERLRVAHLECSKTTVELCDTQETIRQVEKERARVEQELSKHEAELSRLKGLEEELASKVGSIAAMEESLSEMHRQQSQLQDRLLTAEEDANRLGMELKQSTEAEALKVMTIENLTSKLDERGNELAHIRDSHQILEETAKAATTRILQLEEEIETARKRVVEMEETSSRLLHDLEKASRDFGKERELRREELDNALSELGSAQVQVDILEKELKATEQAETALEEEKARMSETLRVKSEESAKYQALLEIAEADRSVAEERVNVLEGQLTGFLDLQKRHEDTEKELNTVKTQLVLAQDLNGERGREITEMSKELEQTKKKAEMVDPLLSEQDTLQSELIQMETEITQLETQLSQNRRERDRAEAAGAEATKELSQVLSQVECLKVELEDCKDRLRLSQASSLEKEENASHEARNLRRKIEDIEEAANNQRTQEVDELKEKLSRLGKERDELFEELERAQIAVGDKCGLLATSRQTIDSLKSEQRRLATSLAVTKEQLRQLVLERSKERSKGPRSSIWVAGTSAIVGMAIAGIIGGIRRKKEDGNWYEQ